MKKFFLLQLIIIITVFNAIAQPHIEGTVEIDLKTGMFNCDFVINNLPEIRNYKILLNHGMNVKYFKDLDDNLWNYNGYYSGKMRGEALEYFFIDDDRKVVKELPKGFKVMYTGAFPKYMGEVNTFDFKGYIAINEKTIRATEQSKWYPVIYDVKKNQIINEYTYNLTIKTKNSESIFINGNPPVKGDDVKFESKKAVPLFLFIGNYDFTEHDGDYLINSNKNSEEIKRKVFKQINLIKKWYAEKLHIKFEDHIYIINHDAVKKMKTGSSWAFNVYPAFGFAGIDYNKMFKDEEHFIDSNYAFFGHELGHNYFGSNMMTGKLSWFWSESFSEYLSFGVIERFSNEAYLKKRLRSFLSDIKDTKFIPLEDIKSSDEIDVVYRYRLGPLIMKCFEDTFGKEKTYSMLSIMAKHTETLTIDSWEEIAVLIGIDKKEFKDFRKKYLKNKNFKENVVKWIQKKY